MLRTHIIFLGLAALAACSSTPAPKPELESAAPEVASPYALRVSGNRIFLPASVNGVKTEALLDSGAELTLVDRAFAGEAGLIAFGEAEARGTGEGTESVQFAEGVTLAAAGKTMEGQVVAILDLSEISARVVSGAVTVILGRELFDAGVWRLDIEGGTLEAVGPEELPANGALALTDAHGIKQVDILLNGFAVKADFDLGNGNEVLLSRSFAEQAGLLDPANILGVKEGGGVGSAVERTIVRVDRLEIGGHVLTGLTAAVSPNSDGADANIGVSVLRQFGLIIDFPGNRVWLEAQP